MRNIIFTPSSGWRWMKLHSSTVSRAGLRSTSPGTATLPMSCSRPATPTSASACRGSPSACPMLTESTLTFTQWA